MVNQAINDMSEEELEALIRELTAAKAPEDEKPEIVAAPAPAIDADALATKIASQIPRAPEPARTANALPEFSQEEFAKLFTTNAGAGQEYYEKTKYGAPLSQILPGLIQTVITQQGQLAELNAYRASASVPDYDKNRAVVDKLVAERGWQPSAQSYQDALDIAKSRGLIGGEAPAPAAPSRTAAPPRLTASRGGQSADDSIQALLANSDNLSDAQIEALARRAGIITNASYHN